METVVGMRSKVKVYGNDYNTKDGTGVRDYVHVVDLAKAHINSIKYINNMDKDLTINLGSGTGYSVLDIIKKVNKISKKNIRYCIVDRNTVIPIHLLQKPIWQRPLSGGMENIHVWI